MSQLLAQTRHSATAVECPLLGVKQTLIGLRGSDGLAGPHPETNLAGSDIAPDIISSDEVLQRQDRFQ
jgi:hypothetical protein